MTTRTKVKTCPLCETVLETGEVCDCGAVAATAIVVDDAEDPA